MVTDIIEYRRVYGFTTDSVLSVVDMHVFNPKINHKNTF